ncbi:MAG: alpha/beta hydrolase [PVC group bacterium]|nr:alpha/beta hydrolase [PVC group bacterium]
MGKKLLGIVKTKDNIKISYEHRQNGFPSVVIVCPGFFNSKKNRWIRRTVDIVSEEHDAIVLDFRGHGDSGGLFTWSAKDYYDVQAIVEYARSCGYESIGILGYSLGAAAAVNAVSYTKDIRSMILISGPYDFWQINYHFWEPEVISDLKDNIDCAWEGKGARVDSLFIPKPKPITQIKRITETPILLIHGTRDWIIKDYHSQKLFDAAPGEKKIELIKGGLHAERLIQQYPERMKRLILGWLKKTMG